MQEPTFSQTPQRPGTNEPVDPKDYDLWDHQPRIPGFSDEECKLIYSGNFQSVIDRFSSMPTGERDKAVINLLGELGSTSHALAIQYDALVDIAGETPAEMLANNAKRKETLASLTAVDNFHEALMVLYTGSDLDS